MNIAIAGFGVEGQESLRYWSNDPRNKLTVFDEHAAVSIPFVEGASSVQSVVGPGAFEKLDGFDLVIRTAGLSPYKIHTDATVWSATNEFFAKCPAPIIGVTGSKGKGTTASLIASILESAGRRVWLVGNIGKPSLSILDEVSPQDIVVYELSSYQLWDLQQSPQTAVVLFIEPEHLDVHTDMEDYLRAKAQIVRYQAVTDRVIYNIENQYASAIANTSVAQKFAYPSTDGAHIKEDLFYYGTEALCPVDALQIKGPHNQQNALAAIAAAWQYTQDRLAFEKGLKSFAGLPHRLAYVASVEGVDFYDDSIATTPGSAIAALRTFPNRKKSIILGGSSKGADFTELARELTLHDVRAVLIGDEAGSIAAACDTQGFMNYEILGQAGAEQFTKRAFELAQPGGVVLLSPAAASFGLFKDYVDRGEQFTAAVRGLSS